MTLQALINYLDGFRRKAFKLNKHGNEVCIRFEALDYIDVDLPDFQVTEMHNIYTIRGKVDER